MKWAALLHDITKRGEPEFKGKDHIHPFQSGMATLRIFKEFGIIATQSDKEEKEFERLLSLIDKSRDPV